NACETHRTKRTIDWAARESAFRDVVENAKARSSGYDCLIPVSGGKDSTWQVVKCLEYGLNPLTVTWRTPGRTEVGERNLANLVRLGVDTSASRSIPRSSVGLCMKPCGFTARLLCLCTWRSSTFRRGSQRVSIFP